MRTSILALSLALQAICPGQAPVIEDAHRHTVEFHTLHTKIVFADIDHDGLPDLLNGSHNRNVGWVGCYRNMGDGVFEPFPGQTSWLPFSADGKFAIGDLNGDGHLDVVISRGGWVRPFYATLMMFGDGAGNFAEASASQFVTRPTAINAGAVIEDVDLDGDLDLICGGLFLNDGKGTFQDVSGTHLPIPFQPDLRSIIALDFSGDGYPDLYYGGGAYVNDGTGRFALFQYVIQSRLEYPSVENATAYRVGNADGLVFGNGMTSWGRYFEPISDRLFLPSSPSGKLVSAPFQVASGLKEHTRDIACGDMDGDGSEDLVLAVAGQNRIFLNWAGKFIDATALSLPVRLDKTTAVGVADLDGDGDLDIGFANAPGRVYILLNDGVGRFKSVAHPRFDPPPRDGKPKCVGVRLIDADSDGDLDYVDSDGLHVNDGTGYFVRDLRPFGPALFHYPISDTGDFDGDGDEDIVTFGGALRLFLNDGTGAFVGIHQRVLPQVSGVSSITEGDVDGDGDTDLIYSGVTSGGQLWSPQGYAAMSAMSLSVPAQSCVELIDLDRDGDLDLLSWTASQTIVHHNNGLGVFVRSAPMPFGVEQFGDIDGDGLVDLLSSRLHINDGAGGFKPSVSVHRKYASPWGSKLVDFDGDGDLDVLVIGGGTIGWSMKTENILYENDGAGQFSRVRTRWYDPIPYPGPYFSQHYGDIDQDGDIDFVRIDKGSGHRARWVLINAVRHLECPYMPRLGKTIQYIVHAEPGHAPTGLVTTILMSSQRRSSPLDLGSIGKLWLGSLRIATPIPLSIPSPAGLVTANLAIPNLPSLAGVEVHAQALIVDLRGSSGMHLTNLVSRTLWQ